MDTRLLWGRPYITPGEIFENMVQLARFSVHVYLKQIQKINNCYFHIEIMISAACTHVRVYWRACSPEKFFKQMAQFGAF